MDRNFRTCRWLFPKCVTNYIQKDRNTVLYFSAQCRSSVSDNDDSIGDFFKEIFSELYPGAQFGSDKLESRIKQNGEFGKVTRMLKVLPNARNKESVSDFLIDITEKNRLKVYHRLQSKICENNVEGLLRKIQKMCLWTQA